METLGYFYNRGKQDGSKHHYEPPHGLVDALMAWRKQEASRIEEENMAYEKGYFYKRGLEDGKDGLYEPPSLEYHKVVYDEGFNKENRSKVLHIDR